MGGGFVRSLERDYDDAENQIQDLSVQSSQAHNEVKSQYEECISRLRINTDSYARKENNQTKK